MDKKWFEDMENRIPRGKVRTRFAPSPTGYMHVGNLRTALFTYYIARHSEGTFILRIEDTDQKRKVEDSVSVIKHTLADCGIHYDEGPDIGGPVGPYIQTERREIYRNYAELLIEKGAAYRCFCSEERLEELRKTDPNAKYDGHCRNLSPEEIENNLKAGIPYVIRQKIPEGQTTFEDAVYGTITVQNEELDDQILLKSDGLPTYNFANVVDDHLMGITHVVRGSEYLSSAPKYNILYKAFGWEVPTYIHCASVMISDSKTGKIRKMSKRMGDPSYEDLISLGYLAPAVVNYVSLLGWAPKGENSEREFFSMDELIREFQIDGISKSPSTFDIEKLKYFNAHYIENLPENKFAQMAQPYIDAVIKDPEADKTLIPSLLQSRINCLSEIPEKIAFMGELPDYSSELYKNKKNKLDQKTSEVILKREKEELMKCTDWSYDALHSVLYDLSEEFSVKIGKIMWPLRIALSGQSITPGGAIEICLVLGKGESLRRIDKGLEKLSDC